MISSTKVLVSQDLCEEDYFFVILSEVWPLCRFHTKNQDARVALIDTLLDEPIPISDKALMLLLLKNKDIYRRVKSGERQIIMKGRLSDGQCVDVRVTFTDEHLIRAKGTQCVTSLRLQVWKFCSEKEQCLA